jgi:hypothetical protein
VIEFLALRSAGVWMPHGEEKRAAKNGAITRATPFEVDAEQ